MIPYRRLGPIHIFEAWLPEEGIFEFTRQVLNSWPIDARHAWCCMLANPQNLNIERLICEPKTSPFAIALASAKYVLVVPNLSESVYARLWCAYEAFLAFEHEKIILTAARPCFSQKFRAASAVLVSFCTGLCIGRWTTGLQYQARTSRWLVILFSLCILVSNFCAVPRCRRIAHLMAAAFAGVFAVAALAPMECPKDLVAVYSRLCALFWCLMGLCVLVSEVDQLDRQSTQASEQSLQAGYQGSCCKASCSREDDAARIWQEIGSRSSAVDSTIAVLLKAGMSTASLRRASAAGVDVKNAGDADHATVLLPT